MRAVNFEKLDLMRTWVEDDPEAGVAVNFPFFQSNGSETLAVVYFEIEPGKLLPTHTDSAEEVVLVLQGTVEASLGDERGRLTAGEMVHIPTMVPHGVRNVGDETARCVGFFSAGHVESTFEQPVMPLGIRVFKTADIPVAEPV
jgi:quercetin dioxygenase-like cupin family protein